MSKRMSMAAALEQLTGRVQVAEREALRLIIRGAEILELDGRAYLLTPVTPGIIDALAAFEAVAEDLEDEDTPDDGMGNRPCLAPAITGLPFGQRCPELNLWHTSVRRGAA